MKTWISVGLAIILGISLVGCSNVNSTAMDSPKTYIGMFSGALIGGLAGDAVRGSGGGRLNYIAVGALVGALIGGGLGMVLGEKDQAAKANTMAINNNPYDKSFRVLTHPSTQRQRAKAAVAGKKEKTVPKNVTMSDSLLNFWDNLPSTQWFFDDGKQTDVG